MQNEHDFPQLTRNLSRVVVATLRLEPSSRRCFLVRPHGCMDRGFDGGNCVGRRPHVAGDPPGQNGGVQPAPAGEVCLSLRPAVFDVLRDGFHQVFPQRPSLPVDLGQTVHVNVRPRRVGVSRRSEARHDLHATAWSVLSQGLARVGGTEAVLGADTRFETQGGAR